MADFKVVTSTELKEDGIHFEVAAGLMADDGRPMRNMMYARHILSWVELANPTTSQMWMITRVRADLMRKAVESANEAANG